MILNAMLSSSPGFLFAVSLLLLAAYGLARLAGACLQVAHRALFHRGHLSAHS